MPKTSTTPIETKETKVAAQQGGGEFLENSEASVKTTKQQFDELVERLKELVAEKGDPITNAIIINQFLESIKEPKVALDQGGANIFASEKRAIAKKDFEEIIKVNLAESETNKEVLFKYYETLFAEKIRKVGTGQQAKKNISSNNLEQFLKNDQERIKYAVELNNQNKLLLVGLEKLKQEKNAAEKAAEEELSDLKTQFNEKNQELSLLRNEMVALSEAEKKATTDLANASALSEAEKKAIEDKVTQLEARILEQTSLIEEKLQAQITEQQAAISDFKTSNGHALQQLNDILELNNRLGKEKRELEEKEKESRKKDEQLQKFAKRVSGLVNLIADTAENKVTTYDSMSFYDLEGFKHDEKITSHNPLKSNNSDGELQKKSDMISDTTYVPNKSVAQTLLTKKRPSGDSNFSVDSVLSEQQVPSRNFYDETEEQLKYLEKFCNEDLKEQAEKLRQLQEQAEKLRQLQDKVRDLQEEKEKLRKGFVALENQFGDDENEENADSLLSDYLETINIGVKALKKSEVELAQKISELEEKGLFSQEELNSLKEEFKTKLLEEQVTTKAAEEAKQKAEQERDKAGKRLNIQRRGESLLGQQKLDEETKRKRAEQEREAAVQAEIAAEEARQKAEQEMKKLEEERDNEKADKFNASRHLKKSRQQLVKTQLENYSGKKRLTKVEEERDQLLDDISGMFNANSYTNLIAGLELDKARLLQAKTAAEEARQKAEQEGDQARNNIKAQRVARALEVGIIKRSEATAKREKATEEAAKNAALAAKAQEERDKNTALGQVGVLQGDNARLQGEELRLKVEKARLEAEELRLKGDNARLQNEVTNIVNARLLSDQEVAHLRVELANKSSSEKVVTVFKEVFKDRYLPASKQDQAKYSSTKDDDFSVRLKEAAERGFGKTKFVESAKNAILANRFVKAAKFGSKTEKAEESLKTKVDSLHSTIGRGGEKAKRGEFDDYVASTQSVSDLEIEYYKTHRSKILADRGIKDLSKAGEKQIVEQITKDKVAAILKMLPAIVAKLNVPNPQKAVAGFNAAEMTVLLSVGNGEGLDDWREHNSNGRINHSFLGELKKGSREDKIRSKAVENFATIIKKYGDLFGQGEVSKEVMQSRNVKARSNSPISIADDARFESKSSNFKAFSNNVKASNERVTRNGEKNAVPRSESLTENKLKKALNKVKLGIGAFELGEKPRNSPRISEEKQKAIKRLIELGFDEKGNKVNGGSNRVQ